MKKPLLLMSCCATALVLSSCVSVREDDVNAPLWSWTKEEARKPAVLDPAVDSSVMGRVRYDRWGN